MLDVLDSPPPSPAPSDSEHSDVGDLEADLDGLLAEAGIQDILGEVLSDSSIGKAAEGSAGPTSAAAATGGSGTCNAAGHGSAASSSREELPRTTWRVEDGERVWSHSGQLLGKLRWWGDRNVTATCEIHKGCRRLVRWWDNDSVKVVNAIGAWLAAGVNLTVEHHQELYRKPQH